MSPIGHFAVGLAAKPAAPKVPLFVLSVATLILDLLYFVFAFAGMEGVNKESRSGSLLPLSLKINSSEEGQKRK